MFALLVLAAALLLSSGCARRNSALLASYTPGPDGTPRRGGHIVLMREEDPDYLDPALSYGLYSAPIIEAIHRTLLEYDDAPGEAGARMHPEIAESMPELREGGTLYAFKVRREARFGAPVHRHITGADFKYSIERLYRVASPGVTFYTGIVGADRVLAGRDSVIPGLIARGDSFYVRLYRPDPIFLHILTMSFTAPVPREVTDKYKNSFSQHVVATGPYQVAEFTPRRRVLMVRNPDYFGRPGWADTVELQLGVSAVNACAKIRRGLGDGGMFEIPPGEFVDLLSDSTWSHQVSVADGLNTEYLFMNVRVKPFDDVRVRQAVCWALDHEALRKAYSGKADLAGEFLPAGMPGAARLGRYEPRDVARVRRLLAEAGYPRGFKTRLYGWTAEPGPRVVAMMQQELAEVGIEVTLDLGETVGYTAMAADTSNRVPFGMYAWNADYVDPSNFFSVLMDGRRITPTNNNDLSMFDDAEVNRRIDVAMAEADPARRAARWREVDERVMDLAPVAPYLHRLESRLWSPRVGGWYRHVTRILKIESLFVKEPAAAGRTALAR
jgi:ABC-type transport system substrate-binding protein